MNHTNSPLDMQQCADAWKAIGQAKRITLLTHRNPDGDAMGSCAALSAFLKHHHKQVETIYPNKPDFPGQLQPDPVRINEHSFDPDLLVVCDTANYDRLYFPSDFQHKPLINIDHHVSNSIEGTYNFVNASCSSTCELLYDILRTWNASALTVLVADSLLSGIVDDTQLFQVPSSTSKTLRVVADLMDAGASLSKRTEELITDQNPASIKLWAHILASIIITPSGQCAWAQVTRKDLAMLGVTPAHLTGFNNFLARISGVDITLLFYETEDGMTKVSLRSKRADVNKLAAPFGGGGHIHAAGIRSDQPIDVLVRKLTAAL